MAFSEQTLLPSGCPWSLAPGERVVLHCPILGCSLIARSLHPCHEVLNAESTQRKEPRKGSRAQAAQEARMLTAGLSFADCSHPPAHLPLPKSLLSKAFYCLFANHTLRIRTPLPMLFFHTGSQPCHLAYASYLLRLPRFPPQPNPTNCYCQALPELLLCQGVSIVCGRIWTRPGARSPTSLTTGARLSCSSVLRLLPVWHMALCTRHMLGRKGEG